MEKARELKAVADAKFEESPLGAVNGAEALVIPPNGPGFANIDFSGSRSI
jgi:hypothetical protein